MVAGKGHLTQRDRLREKSMAKSGWLARDDPTQWPNSDLNEMVKREATNTGFEKNAKKITAQKRNR